MSRIQFRVEALDVPPAQAAHRMGLTLAQFNAALPDLQVRGFPAADPTTGNYDLEAVDAWRRSRNVEPSARRAIHPSVALIEQRMRS